MQGRFNLLPVRNLPAYEFHSLARSIDLLVPYRFYMNDFSENYPLKKEICQDLYKAEQSVHPQRYDGRKQKIA
jgi:hypothetical protein